MGQKNWIRVKILQLCIKVHSENSPVATHSYSLLYVHCRCYYNLIYLRIIKYNNVFLIHLSPSANLHSTELMRRVRRFQVAQYNCLVIKYARDTRYSDTGMATHDK